MRNDVWIPRVSAPDCTAFISHFAFRIPHCLPGVFMKLNRITPMLPVRDISASADFYGRLGFRVEKKSDEWGWALLALGDCHLMIDQSINLHRDVPRQGVLYLYPEDIAAFHEEVRRNGLAVPDLEMTFYGMTEFRIDDPDGNRLWIGQNVPAEE
jgi:catechol 2,3-dioxygenase-like lactoylglutathione lyase family enzyme